ncbi:MAG: Gfo/Idh/MocA family protein [Tepidisphaerales bacterium]
MSEMTTDVVRSYERPKVPLRLAVVGLRMGRAHADGASASGCFEVAGLCDLDEGTLASAAERFPNARTFRDFREMLEGVRPEVVVVATPNRLHYEECVMALESPGLRGGGGGRRGLMVEKPMTLTLGQARDVLRRAKLAGVAVAVNHQRRTWPAFRTMRKLMTSGAIGTPQLIRASCAGDFLSDGTHLVDTCRYLAGDVPVRRVWATVFRQKDGYYTGERYGHTVDTAAMAVIDFEGGLRAELHTGQLQPPGRSYQDYEVFGTEGRLWRAGDGAAVPLLLQDTAGGWRQVKLEPFDVPEHPNLSLAGVYVRFYQQIAEGRPNPMSGEAGVAAMEICHAVYESARLNRVVTLPVEGEVDRWVLDEMIAAGRF